MRVGNRVGDTPHPGRGAPLHPLMITLKEFGSAEVPLTPEAYAALRSRYAREIGVEITERAGVYRVTARDYVGRVGLPGGSILIIQPEVGVANLFYMLCAE